MMKTGRGLLAAALLCGCGASAGGTLGMLEQSMAAARKAGVHGPGSCAPDGTCWMAGWGWSDPGEGLGETGPGAVPLPLSMAEGISGPPRLAGGQLYDVRFDSQWTQGAATTLRLKWPGRWRFQTSAEAPLSLAAINVNCETRDNPDPALRRVPAQAPFVAAWEADMAAGWYILAFEKNGLPRLLLRGEPVRTI